MIVLALIGTGRFGQRYIDTITKLQGIQLKYICTSNEKKEKLYSTQFTVVKDSEKLLEYPDIDGIIICTPASSHYQIASLFLKEGKNLLIEKPFTTSYQHAKKLFALWKERKPIVLIGHIFLYHPAFEKVFDLKRKLGSVRIVDIHSGNWGPFRSDVSTLWDWSPHDIAMCLRLMDKMPIAVEAYGDVVVKDNPVFDYDVVRIHLYFQGGAIATIHNSRISPEKIRKVTVIGDRASVIFNDMIDDKITFYQEKSMQYPQKHSNKQEIVQYGHERPLASEISAFAKSIQQKTQPLSDITLGLNVVRILQTAEISIKKQKKISLPKE